MDLRSTQLKDTYGNLLTIGTSAGSPTTGTIENGDGQDITDLRIGASGDSATESTLKIFSQGRVNATVLKENSDGASLIVGSANRLSLGTSNDEKMRIEADGDIAFYDDANNQGLFWDASTARLGLGTQTPSVPLEVNVSGAGDVFKLTRDTGTNGELNIDFAGANANFASAQGGYTFTTSSVSSAMTIASNGDVGIGISPIRKLHIDGGSISSDTSTVRISSTDSSGTNKFGIEFYSNSGADVRGKVLADNNGRVYIDDNGGGGVVLQANGGSGNVGIGTNPDTNLHVKSTSSTPTARIESTHPSGIPFLDLKGAASSQIRYLDETGTIQTRMDFSDNGGISFVDVAGSASTRMKIDTSGNVLVGKTTADDGATAGIEQQAGGALYIAKNATNLLINRLSTDGEIVNFRKDGTTVGSIGTRGGEITFHQGDTGIRLRGGTDNIIPVDASGAGRSNAIDIGSSSEKFKDLYLGGTSYVSQYSAPSTPTIVDDAFYTLTPQETIGFLLLGGRNDSYDNINGLFSYRVTANTYCTLMSRDNTSVETAEVSGVPTITDYTNGKVTVVVSTNGNIYIANREGGSISVNLILFGQ